MGIEKENEDLKRLAKITLPKGWGVEVYPGPGNWNWTGVGIFYSGIVFLRENRDVPRVKGNNANETLDKLITELWRREENE